MTVYKNNLSRQACTNNTCQADFLFCTTSDTNMNLQGATVFFCAIKSFVWLLTRKILHGLFFKSRTKRLLDASASVRFDSFLHLCKHCITVLNDACENTQRTTKQLQLGHTKTSREHATTTICRSRWMMDTKTD